MAIDIYGETYADNWDYARRIVTKGAKSPLYRFTMQKINTSMSVNFFKLNGDYIQKKTFDKPGLYAIYRMPVFNKEFECLYVGYSDYSVLIRLHRFAKELACMSRDDEDHPGAEKARHAGVTITDNLFVMFMATEEFPPNDDVRGDISYIDRTVAVMLKSRFNTIKRY